jgi:tRNA dimethylallyltransferase
MKKLLIICGPTATGKTELALYLAKKFNGELISADSRQVYKWMDIGTGKDIPEGFEFRVSSFEFEDIEVCYYTNGNIRIWGYDLVKPTEGFSAGRYVKIVKRIIGDIYDRDKLPILVGGTGLYIKGVVDGIKTAEIPKNAKLRKSLEQNSAGKLYNILARVDPTKAASLNLSDKNNPRRLIRAIEVADYYQNNTDKKGIQHIGFDKLFVGLTMPRDLLNKRIKARVHKRMKQDIESEINELFIKGVVWRHQSMDALGYRQWEGYFNGSLTKDEVVIKWINDEVKYAKRQMTWFKKDKRITWFDINGKNWKLNVEKVVNKWYKSR